MQLSSSHVSVSSLLDKSAIQYFYRIYYYIVHINKLISVDIYIYTFIGCIFYYDTSFFIAGRWFGISNFMG